MGHEAHEHHVMPLSVYYAVFSTLIFLTFVTVGVSYLGLPPSMSIVVAMAVACVKATFVATWFMHLIHDTKFNILLFLSSFWFIGAFFLFTSLDFMTRDRVMKHSGTFEFRQDRAEATDVSGK